MERGCTKPLISVVIPTYNRGYILPTAVNSVLEQSYRNLEIIIVDDGSVDGTREYVTGITDDRVRYVRSEKNKGPSAARNLGARLARGEFLAFQDSDDEWLPGKLEKQVAVLLEENTEMVYCEYCKYNGRAYRTVPSKEIPREEKQGNLFPYLLLHSLIGTPTIVVKKDTFSRLGGFNEMLQAYEDYEFTLRFSREYPISFKAETLVKVNQSRNSVDQRGEGRIRAQFYMIGEMLEDLREQGLLWIKLEKVLREAMALKCHDVFLEELERLRELVDSEEEQEQLSVYVQEIEESDEKINQFQVGIYRDFFGLKQKALEYYLQIYKNGPMQAETLRDVEKQIRKNLERCMRYFEIPKEVYERISMGKEVIPNQKTEQLYWLTNIVGMMEELEKSMGKKQECNVCGCEVFYKSDGKCPICKAHEEERLIVAFLEELKPKDVDKLRMLQMMESETLAGYGMGRPDLVYETINEEMSQGFDGKEVFAMHAKPNHFYDIVICPEEALDADGMLEEVYRILNDTGILVFITASLGEGYSNMGIEKKVENAGFRLDIIDQEWFGDPFWQQYGFGEQTALHIAVKNVVEKSE